MCIVNALIFMVFAYIFDHFLVGHRHRRYVCRTHSTKGTGTDQIFVFSWHLIQQGLTFFYIRCKQIPKFSDSRQIGVLKVSFSKNFLTKVSPENFWNKIILFRHKPSCQSIMIRDSLSVLYKDTQISSVWGLGGKLGRHLVEWFGVQVKSWDKFWNSNPCFLAWFNFFVLIPKWLTNFFRPSLN